MPARGGEPVTVPGRGRAVGARRRPSSGRLGLAELLAPAREIAERGFPVAAVSARMWRGGGGDAAARRGRRGGVPARRPRAARGRAASACPTSRARSARSPSEGPRAFYEGEIAERIVAATRAAGGFLEPEDMAAHRSTWVEPIHGAYRDLEVHELPPPTTGIAALMILRALAREDLAALDPLAPSASTSRRGRPARVRGAARARRRPDFVDVPVAEMLAGRRPGAPPLDRPRRRRHHLPLRGRRARATAARSSTRSTRRSAPASSRPAPASACTTAGCGFSLDERSPSALAPGKRPLHTIIPGAGHARRRAVGGLREHGRLHAAAGPRPGARQPPRPRDGRRRRPSTTRATSSTGGVLLVEGRVPERRDRQAAPLGPRRSRSARPTRSVTGGAQVVRLHEDGVRAAGSDPRKDGCALAQSP